MTPHESLMRLALEEAEAAFREGEVPVGAVVAKDGRPVARAHNLREQTGDPTAHAELLAIREAARALAFRFGEEMKGLLEEGVLCAGLDKFYEDGAALWQAAGKHSAVLCENFARTVPDVRLTATVNMPAHALPPWAGEVRALAEELEPLLAQKYAVCVLAGTRRAGEALARDLARAGLSAAFYAKLPQACPPGHVAVAAGSVTACRRKGN